MWQAQCIASMSCYMAGAIFGEVFTGVAGHFVWQVQHFGGAEICFLASTRVSDKSPRSVLAREFHKPCVSTNASHESVLPRVSDNSLLVRVSESK